MGTQLQLFEQEKAERRERRRRGQQKSKLARDEALDRVEDNAEAGWLAAAEAAIAAYALDHETLSADELWPALPDCHEPRVLGAAMRRARKAGVIEPTPYFRCCSRQSRNAAPVRIWRSLIYAHPGA
jgi:hypothetical protein